MISKPKTEEELLQDKRDIDAVVDRVLDDKNTKFNYLIRKGIEEQWDYMKFFYEYGNNESGWILDDPEYEPVEEHILDIFSAAGYKVKRNKFGIYIYDRDRTFEFWKGVTELDAPADDEWKERFGELWPQNGDPYSKYYNPDFEESEYDEEDEIGTIDYQLDNEYNEDSEVDSEIESEPETESNIQITSMIMEKKVEATQADIDAALLLEKTYPRYKLVDFEITPAHKMSNGKAHAEGLYQDTENPDAPLVRETVLGLQYLKDFYLKEWFGNKKEEK